MLPHLLRLAWRHIRNHRLYTLIHVIGLSIGICACVVIWLIVHYDLSFDRFHPDSNRIYRIIGDQTMPDGQRMYMNSPYPAWKPKRSFTS
jgi:putative ABC transport system permease protein